MTDEGRSIGRASAVMAAGTIVSRLLGFVRSVVLVSTVGVTASGAADAFALANQLPNNVYVLVAGGVLNAVLVPQLVRAGVHLDSGRVYVNRLLTLSLLLLAGITLLATLLAPLIVLVYAGASADATGDVIALAIAFAYWCLPQIFFYGLYTLLSEVLNARSAFGPPMWAPVINNVVAITGLIVFLVTFGPRIDGAEFPPSSWTPAQIALLGGSATLGIAAQALTLFLSWRRAGLSFRPDFHFRGTGLRAIGRAASWTFAMLIVMQLGGILSTQVAFVATDVGASIAALQTAWLVFMLPHSIVAVSVTTVFFTRMSGHASEGRMTEFGRDLANALSVVGVVNAFAAAALAVTALPFSRVFVSDPLQVEQLSQVIIAYMPGLVGFGALFVVQRGFFALEDTRTPFLLTSGYVVLFSIGNLLCLLLPVTLIGVGIAVVTSVGTTIHAAVAAAVLRRRIGAFGLRRLAVAHARFVGAALVSALLGVGTLWMLGGFAQIGQGFATGGIVPAVLSMLVIGTVMLAAYIGALLALRSPEPRELIGLIARRR